MSITCCDLNVANTFLCAYNESIEESVAAYFATPRDTSKTSKEEETKEEEEERRINASDGGLYTEKEFIAFYGDSKEWDVAEKVKSVEEYERILEEE